MRFARSWKSWPHAYYHFPWTRPTTPSSTSCKASTARRRYSYPGRVSRGTATRAIAKALAQAPSACRVPGGWDSIAGTKKTNTKRAGRETMTAEVTGAGVVREKSSLGRVMLASAVGSALEWYDFFIYGTAAALVFNELFFPKLDPRIGTLAAFATFGVGFFARPFGGLVFGHFCHPLRRKPMLVWTLLLDGGPALLVALGLCIRVSVAETAVFAEVAERRKPLKAPVLDAIRRHPRSFLVVIGSRMAENGLGYLFPVFGLNYVVQQLQLPRSEALFGVILSQFLSLATIPLFSALSDRVGPRPVYLGAALFSAPWAFPFFLLCEPNQACLIWLAFIGASAIGVSRMFRPHAPSYSHLFRPPARFCGLSLPAAGRGGSASLRLG